MSFAKHFLIALLICATAGCLNAQTDARREIKSDSPASTGEFFITPLDRNSHFMITKLRLTPGSYNEWHIHPDAAQTTFVIDGQGYYQEEGGPVRLLTAGESVTTPANIKHWNGSTPDSPVTIISITAVKDKPHVEWLGKISPEVFYTGRD